MTGNSRQWQHPQVFDSDFCKRISWGILTATIFVALFLLLGLWGLLPTPR